MLELPRIAQNVLILIVLVLISLPARAQETNLTLNVVSPKLRKLLVANPQAFAALNTASSLAFRTNRVGICYFYHDGDTKARAFHYYPHLVDLPEVVILVRENQRPLDEYICILFELLNSQKQDQFEKLFDQARAGAIGRTEFARGVLRVEFETTKKTKEIVNQMKIRRREKASCYYYPLLRDCPNDFEAFFADSERAAKEYEDKYDALRKSAMAN